MDNCISARTENWRKKTGATSNILTLLPHNNSQLISPEINCELSLGNWNSSVDSLGTQYSD